MYELTLAHITTAEHERDLEADLRQRRILKASDAVRRAVTADLANTILKMAAKRAYVDGALKTLRASALFTQDLEDMPAGADHRETDSQQTEARELFCSARGCGQQILESHTGRGESRRTISPAEIAEKSMARFNQVLCPDCYTKAVKAEKEAKARDEQKAPDEGAKAGETRTWQQPALLAQINQLGREIGAETALCVIRTLPALGELPDFSAVERILDEEALGRILEALKAHQTRGEAA
jgi:hypothetical protein